MAVEAMLWQNVNHFYDKWLFTVVTCSPTSNVYCDIVSGHNHKQLSCTKPLPWGYISKINVTRNSRKLNFTIVLHHYIWLNFLSQSISHSKVLELASMPCPLGIKYLTLHRLAIIARSNPTVHSSSLLATSACDTPVPNELWISLLCTQV